MNKISEVPMLTADEQEIELNSILYDVSYSDGRYDERMKAEIIPHRVISVNEAHRHYRMRCPKGCEIEVSYKAGCGRTKYYGTMTAAKAELQSRILEDMQGLKSKIGKLDDSLTKVKNKLAEVKGLGISDLKNPKAVKVTKEQS